MIKALFTWPIFPQLFNDVLQIPVSAKTVTFFSLVNPVAVDRFPRDFINFNHSEDDVKSMKILPTSKVFTWAKISHRLRFEQQQQQTTTTKNRPCEQHLNHWPVRPFSSCKQFHNLTLRAGVLFSPFFQCSLGRRKSSAVSPINNRSKFGCGFDLALTKKFYCTVP